jgi:tetratricopeptide (TPR) repeat protein
VARAIAGAHAGKLDEHAALLAHHWEGAGEALEAARWHQRAAAWAGERNLAESLRHWKQVPELLREVPETAETMRLGVEARFHALSLGWRLGLAEEEVEAMAAEGKALAARSGDPGLLARMVGAHGAIRGGAGATSEYLEASREAMRLARQAEDPRVISYARTLLSLSSFYAGRLADALSFVDEELRELSAHAYAGRSYAVDSDPVLLATVSRSAFLKYTGRLDEAAHDLVRAETLAREQHDQTMLAMALEQQAWGKHLRGEYDDMLRLAQAGLTLVERTGNAFWCSEGHWMLGMCHLGSRRWEEARAALETALSITHGARVNLVAEPLIRSCLAWACAGMGDFERARRLARESVDVLLARRTLVLAISALLNLARVLRLADGAAAAGEIATTLDRTIALIDETGAEVLRPQVHVERAELARLLGDEAARERELRAAQRLFAAMGASGHAQRIAATLGDAPVADQGRIS